MTEGSTRIFDLLQEDCILPGRRPASKEEVLEELAEALCRSGAVKDARELLRLLWEREAQGSTGVGRGVAVPHGRGGCVRRPALAAMTVPEGVDFGSVDGQPVRLVFLIATPPDGKEVHLEALSTLAALLMDEKTCLELEQAATAAGFRQCLCRAEERLRRQEAAGGGKHTRHTPQVLAVTACPTGIAHTYMAARELEKTAARLGVSIKVETNGSVGRRNVLTEEEIRNCDGVIVAADAHVEMDRFLGKPLLLAPVSEGIHGAEGLIRRVVEKDAPIYRGGAVFGQGAARRLGHALYRHLMSGVSHMLPFVIGGGILISLAFLADSILAPGAPAESFGANSPLAYFLNKQAGSVAFGFMLPVLSGYIAKSIADRPGLMVGFVAGALAMRGGAGFLGALLAGFAAGYVMRLLELLLSRLPKSLEGAKPVLLYPVLGLPAVSALTMFILAPPVSRVNAFFTGWLSSLDSIGTVALGFLLAAMMSVDMGGPVNKAAYVFATASLVDASGGPVASPLMASVMLGGMVPPLAIALCTVLFRSRFTEKQRQAGMMNFIMGLSFITEGAVPFAAADLRVIPVCMLGSGVAGGLSAYFRCSLQAPHGGIFAFALVPNWPMYLLALVVGTLVSCLLLGLLRSRLPGRKSA